MLQTVPATACTSSMHAAEAFHTNEATVGNACASTWPMGEASDLLGKSTFHKGRVFPLVTNVEHTSLRTAVRDAVIDSNTVMLGLSQSIENHF